ncbi:SMI1/KNR4 family protein [Gemmata sp. G18]|uniref:SMI1/KNR4 family protein n=1 Tax=Gemmata palustris TaxID=2822762 RepID=A0ABS5BJA5_9BACT|nr:SMI1/KNR4 family protein [Gemmata palustris]MBP3953781.1 SMI1/KNR4 family protein [Gemmata palustris]
MSDLETAWDRIHRWLAAHAPVVLASLGPPATDEHLQRAETEMGVVLPDDVKACYRIHDGQRVIPTPVSYWPDLKCAPSFLYGHRWHSLAGVTDYWHTLHDLRGEFAEVKGAPRGPIRKDWWHAKWIPLTRDSAGDLYCLDLMPLKRGHVGQVIFWYHDEPARGLLAKSLTEWLTQFSHELDRGEFTTAPDTHGPGLVRVRDL